MKKYILFISLFLLLNCKNDKNDINGFWIPKTYPQELRTFECTNGKIKYIGFNNKSEIDNFKIENNKIVLNNNKFFILNSLTINQIEDNQLNFKIENDTTKLIYEKFKLNNNAKFDKIRIDYCNGWNYSSITEISRTGEVTFYDENVHEKIKRKGNGKINSKSLDSIFSFSELIFANNKISKWTKDCADCPTYIYTFERNKIRKRIFIKNTNSNFVFPYLIKSIKTKINEKEIKEIDFSTNIKRLNFPHNTETTIEKIQ